MKIEVDASRIRFCNSVVSVDRDIVDQVRPHVARQICTEIGQAVAAKLYEFHKYAERIDGDRVIFTSRLEIIVPTDAELKAWAAQVNPAPNSNS